jgi:hypothetical protein
VQDQYTSEIRSRGEKSNISTVGAHDFGKKVGWFEVKRRRVSIFIEIGPVSGNSTI